MRWASNDSAALAARPLPFFLLVRKVFARRQRIRGVLCFGSGFPRTGGQSQHRLRPCFSSKAALAVYFVQRYEVFMAAFTEGDAHQVYFVPRGNHSKGGSRVLRAFPFFVNGAPSFMLPFCPLGGLFLPWFPCDRGIVRGRKQMAASCGVLRTVYLTNLRTLRLSVLRSPVSVPPYGVQVFTAYFVLCKAKGMETGTAPCPVQNPTQSPVFVEAQFARITLPGSQRSKYPGLARRE